MNRKAIVGIKVLIYGVVAFVVLFILTSAAAGKYNDFGLFVSLFGFNNSVEQFEGSGIVGYNLDNGGNSYFLSGASIYHYNGNEWVKVPNEEMKIAGQIFNPGDFSREMTQFYFFTSRFKKTWDFPGDSSREILADNAWSIGFGDSGFILFDIIPNNGLSGETSQFYLGLDDKLYSEDKLITDEAYVSLIPKLVAWRDQILQGGGCEKFIEINGESYTVRKQYPYLIVDLNNPASGEEKYNSCSDDFGKSFVNNYDLSVSFVFDKVRKNFLYKSEEDKWVYFGDQKDKFSFSEFDARDFYGGLSVILDKAFKRSHSAFNARMFNFKTQDTIFLNSEIKDYLDADGRIKDKAGLLQTITREYNNRAEEI